MNKVFVSTKYASTVKAWAPFVQKASSWLRGNQTALSWGTTGVAFIVLMVMLHRHHWSAFRDVELIAPFLLFWMVLLWPVNLCLEVAKWRTLTRIKGKHRRWDDAWKEVLVGQSWAFLGPFRISDGAGRLAATRDHALIGKQGLAAFGRGAIAQGWATWVCAIPAMWMVGWEQMAMVACLLAIASGWAMLAWMKLAPIVMMFSAMRYVVFASQYLLCLVAWGALPSHAALTDGYPRIASIWCAIHSLPWPSELGVREAAAAWAFDVSLPAVVSATFFLWFVNRGCSALVGAVVFWTSSIRAKHALHGL